MAGIVPSPSPSILAGIAASNVAAGAMASAAGLAAGPDAVPAASGYADVPATATHPLVMHPTSRAQRFAQMAAAYGPFLGVGTALAAALFSNDWSSLGYLAMAIPVLPLDSGTELARPKAVQASGEPPTAMDHVVYAVRNIRTPLVQSAVVHYAVSRAKEGQGDFVQMLILMLGGYTIPKLQEYAGDHIALKYLPRQGNPVGIHSIPAPKIHIQIVRALHQLNVTTPEAIWAIFGWIPCYDDAYQKVALDALIAFADAGSDYARQCLHDIAHLQFTGDISANSLRRAQEYLAGRYIVGGAAGGSISVSSSGTQMVVRQSGSEQSQQDAVSQLETLAHSNKQHAVTLLFQILRDGTTYWSVATRIVKVLTQLNLKPGNGPKAIEATWIIATRLYASHVDEAYGHAAVDLLGKWAMQWPCAQSILNGVAANPQVPQRVREHAKTVTSSIPDYLDRVDAGIIPDLGDAKAPTDIAGFAVLFGLEETLAKAINNRGLFQKQWEYVRSKLVLDGHPITSGIPDENVQALQLEKEHDGQHPLKDSYPYRVIAKFFNVSIARAEFLMPYLAHLVGSGMTTLPSAGSDGGNQKTTTPISVCAFVADCRTKGSWYATCQRHVACGRQRIASHISAHVRSSHN